MATPDYLIIGGGTAGCVLATRLKERLPQSTVTILEAGTNEHENPLITEMMGTFQLHFTDYEFKYKTTPQKNYNGRQVFIAGGKMVSGSSGCNYGLWSRCSREDFDLWATTVGDKRWSYDGLLPYFRKTESHHQAEAFDQSQHGSTGPIHTAVSTSRPGYPLKNHVLEAFAKSTGLPYKADANAGNPLGITPYTENWRQGKRQPAGAAYGLQGVEVITGALVKRVIVENGAAIGAELTDGKIVNAQKEVIISCGALRSPQVLMLSGIGPQNELSKFGIRQVLSSEAAESVGSNLSDHISVPMFYKVRYPEKNVSAGAPGWTNPDYLLGMPVEMILTLNHSSNELKEAMIKDGHKNISKDHPHLSPNRGHSEIIPAYAAMEAPLTDLGLPFDGTIITSGILCLLPTSRGSVKIASGDPTVDPLVDPNYFDTEADKLITRQAMRTNIKAFETSPLADEIEGHHPSPGQKSLTTRSSDEDLDEYVKRTAATWFHPSGTCAMGKVVDTECRVIGLQRLRVVDASVFPGPLAGHYQAPVYALAEQMADIIAASD